MSRAFCLICVSDQKPLFASGTDLPYCNS